MVEIVAKRGIDDLGIMFCLQLSFIDANELFSFPRFFAEAVVGNAIEPGGKTRFAAKAPEIFVRAQKSLLRQIVGQGNVRADELTQEPADARLMIADQLRKRVVVIREQNAGNKIGIR